MTIGDLADIMNKYATSIETRIDKLEKRMKYGFLAVDKRFDEMDNRFDRLEKKLHTTSQETDENAGTIVDLRVKTREHDKAIAKLNRKVGIA